MEKTFQYQERLPSLPLPPLEQTLGKYLDSVKPFLRDADFARTERIVRHFAANDGRRLHAALHNRAKQRKNWLEDWWDKMYLEIRCPLVPYLNFAGMNPRLRPVKGTQLKRTADHIYYGMEYWLKVRRQEVPVFKQKSTPWDMNQLYRMFNATRVPGQSIDRLVHYFKTEDEGYAPSYLVVLYKDRFWKVETVGLDGCLYSQRQFLSTLEEIQKRSERMAPAPHVCSLTALDRDQWFEARNHLISLSPANRRNIEVIENCVMVITMTDKAFDNDDDELNRYALCGDTRIQWADKSVNMAIHKDGTSSCNCDHSNIDAIVLLTYTNDISIKLLENWDHWRRDENVVADPAPFTELKLDVDVRLKKDMERAEADFQRNAADVDVRIYNYDGFGNVNCRKARLYGDTIVQLSLQLAYYKLHNRPAPTYETASTRRFYHGRTETVRSCTVEAIQFAKLMLDPKTSVQQKLKSFKAAYDRHNQLMREAANGEGVDRHLFGLRETARELSKGCSPKLPEPAIFTDPTWVKAGGDGNFILSTSFLGYDTKGTFGYVTAMCLDGYGTFYKLNDNGITMTISRYKSSQETSLDLWRDSVSWSFDRLGDLLGLTQVDSKL